MSAVLMSTACNGRGLQSKASKIAKKNLQKQIIFFFSLRPYFSFVSPQQEIIAPPTAYLLSSLFQQSREAMAAVGVS